MNSPNTSDAPFSFLQWRDLILLAALWGGSFLFYHLAVPYFGTLPTVVLRLGLGGGLLWAVYRPRIRALTRRQWQDLLIVGLFNAAIPYALFAIVVTQGSASLGAILNATTPLFSIVVTSLWLRQRPAARLWLGGSLAFAGVALLVTQQSGGPLGAHTVPVACGLLAACLYAIAANLVKQRLHTLPSQQIATVSTLIGAAVLVPFAAINLPAAWPPPMAWLGVLGLGVLSTAWAYVLYFRILSISGATRTASVTFLIPVFGMLWAWLGANEQPTWRMMGCTALILIGAAWANANKPSRNK